MKGVDTIARVRREYLVRGKRPGWPPCLRGGVGDSVRHGDDGHFRFAVTKQKKRRVRSAEEKRLICGQSRLPGVSVSQVARRYDVNANLVFTWLRDPRFADSGGEVASLSA